MECPNCQQTVDPGAAFCGACGFKLDASEAPQQAIPEVTAEPESNQTGPIAPAGYPVYVHPDHSGKAITSLVLGVLAIPGCLIPIVGLTFGVVAFIFGTLSYRSVRRKLAIIGMVLAVVAILGSLFLWVRNSQELVRQHNSGETVGATSNDSQLRAMKTPCYNTKLPGDMTITQSSGSCTFLATRNHGTEQEEVKVIQVPSLSMANLQTAAQADAKNVVGAVPGGSITKQGSATFAGSQAYEIEIASTDGSAGTISYIYDSTAQGNLVIVLRTQAYKGASHDLGDIESNWAWL
jgi:hypothetical protein